ncbi:hypothetical protein BNJ_00177 [Kaumoebavirus]|uniref:hypothetical protein n=1 Tax=Kaumoebavirus TaxID=1859492 RepID=UPI0009C372CB|nr:hypothetical protein BNJ_00177 [Kaumoebavirus]ARA72008.1 hypothetical protein BNJ_00177 [Kaumoebavirus]
MSQLYTKIVVGWFFDEKNALELIRDSGVTIAPNPTPNQIIEAIRVKYPDADIAETRTYATEAPSKHIVYYVGEAVDSYSTRIFLEVLTRLERKVHGKYYTTLENFCPISVRSVIVRE